MLPADPALPACLRRELEGEVLFDDFSRGRYATDASFYQIMPVGVVVPRSEQDLERVVQIAVDFRTPIIPRGAGTSQGGQAIGEALIVDTSKYLTRILWFDPEAGRVTVEPGVVLDQLNASLAPNGLFFPVDVATASQATIGGMAGNNSAGARSLRYGLMADNVHAIDAILARLQAMPGFVHSTREGIMAPAVAIEKYLDVTQSEFGGSEAFLIHHGVQQSAIDNFRESMLE